jgi:alpha-tubulin suppressor-like RCC1 family protein
VLVAGGHSVGQVSSGYYHACAHCWGSNASGQLGIGIAQGQRLTPVAVAIGLSFGQVTAGGFHTCGATIAGVAYCWGDDFFGEVGDGTTADARPTPVPVAGPR